MHLFRHVQRKGKIAHTKRTSECGRVAESRANGAEEQAELTQRCSNSPCSTVTCGLAQTDCWAPPPSSESVHLKCSLRMCFSGKFPGEAGLLAQGLHLENHWAHLMRAWMSMIPHLPCAYESLSSITHFYRSHS